MRQQRLIQMAKCVGIAGTAVVAAFGLLEVVLPQGAGAATYATASAAVAVAALAAGLLAGLLAVLLSGVAVSYLHLPPFGTLQVEGLEAVLGLAIFAANGLVVAAAGSMARSHLAQRRTAHAGPASVVAPARRVGALNPTACAPRTSVLADGMVESLTGREVEILGLLAAGLSNEQIAATLYLSVNTVKTHLKNIFGKLGVGSRTQAVARAQALGIIGVVTDMPADEPRTAA